MNEMDTFAVQSKKMESEFEFSVPARAPVKRKSTEPVAKWENTLADERMSMHIEHLTGELRRLNAERVELECESSTKKEQLKQAMLELVESERRNMQGGRELAHLKGLMDKMNGQLAQTVAEIEELRAKVLEEKKKASESQTQKGKETIEILSQYMTHVHKIAEAASEAFYFLNRDVKRPPLE